MTVLSLALTLAANKKSPLANQKRAIAVDKNIHALRSVGATRFVMIEMGSRG